MGRVLLTVILLTSLHAEDPKPRVKAKEPTVVTVEGKRNDVDLHENAAREAETNPFKKTFKMFGRGITRAGAGVVNWVGASFGVDDDIPADRERTAEGQSKEPRQKQ